VILSDSGAEVRDVDGRLHIARKPCQYDDVERGHPVKSVNECAQCGANLIQPEWSEHFPDHRIRNVWSCDACGYEYEDTVYYSARELADAS
jgi:ribosomal protein L37AE/L43A